MDYKKKGLELRKDVLRMIHACGSGHPGGSLSCLDILAALYYGVLRYDAKDAQRPDRDRFVMSKGHSCPALYAILADVGFFPREDLWTLRRIDSYLQGHPDMHKIPGIDASTGSLGQGAAIALGMAMAAKYKGESYRVYTVVGDGECQEGLIWETAMAAAHYHLDNFVMILDHNHLQIDGTNDQIMGIGNIMKKFEAFGFDCVSVDGHDAQAMIPVFKALPKGRPKFVECRTVKGKGVSFMENRVGWHGKAPNDDEFEAALKELEMKEHE